jgi:hypothetical protein
VQSQKKDNFLFELHVKTGTELGNEGWYSGRWSATNTLVQNVSLQLRSYLWRHKHAPAKWFASVALPFEAPQTRACKMVRFSRAPIWGARNTRVQNGSLQSRSYLWRHEYARAKWFASVALLFEAPRIRSCKMVRFSRAPIYGATNTVVGKVRYGVLWLGTLSRNDKTSLQMLFRYFY